MYITATIILILIFIDQLSKYLSQLFLVLDVEKVVINNFFSLTLEYNTGAAWSMGNDATWVLVIISLLGCVILGFLTFKNNWKVAKFKSAALCMAFAGCAGNLFDRIITITPLSEARPGVVDMITFKPFDWLCQALHLGVTVFNVADIYLVVGLILFAIDLIFIDDRRKKKYGKDYNL